MDTYVILSATETQGDAASGATGVVACNAIDADYESEHGCSNDGDGETEEEDASDGWDELHSAGDGSPDADPAWTRR